MIGVAGGLATGVSVGDVVVPEVVVDLSDGREMRPSPLGSVIPHGRLLTSDDFITDQEALGGLRDDGRHRHRHGDGRHRPGVRGPGLSLVGLPGHQRRRLRPVGRRGHPRPHPPRRLPDLGAVTRFVAGNPRRVRLLARLGRDLEAATTGAVTAALAAVRSDRPADPNLRR